MTARKKIIAGKKPLWLFVPVLVILIVMAGFYLGLMREQKGLPSPHIGKPLAPFTLPRLGGGELNMADLANGEVLLLNFFASWCVPCLAEHPVLQFLHAQQIPIIGIVWNDSEENIVKWLDENGNVYTQIAFDPEQYFALDVGVYGIPETFIIDGQGIVRFRWTGALTPELAEEVILPEIEKWR